MLDNQPSPSKELEQKGDLSDKLLPKLYIDWGSPNGDETAISFFDKDGTAHTATGIIARLIAEQAKQLTATQQALDNADNMIAVLSEMKEGYYKAATDLQSKLDSAVETLKAIVKHERSNPHDSNKLCVEMKEMAEAALDSIKE